MMACALAISPAHAAGSDVPKSSVLLEIVDGDTAFIVDQPTQQAWWVVNECRQPIPIKKQENTINTISSEIILENVTLGDRQVTLKQQFRFHLASTPGETPTVEVYNSLRGGWSPVPVEQNANCSLDATCRLRLEYPQC